MSHDFLIEVGTEELPPNSLKLLSYALKKNIETAFQNKKVSFKNSKAFATPRRLTFIAESLDETTPIEEVKTWGPPAKVAFDKQGLATKAAHAFAAKNNLTIDSLQTEHDGKQEKLVCIKSIGGEPTRDLLGAIVNQSLADLPIKKRMRWGISREEFVRPVQWVAMMLDKEILPEKILGIKAGNLTRGHRFHANAPLQITSIGEYESILENQGKVLADFDKRKAVIKKQVEQAARDTGGKAVISDDLLDEVTALVEWPVALAGRFDKNFLSIPSEALISSMKEHQKYFHVVDKKDALKPTFITVSNIASKDPSKVVDGNERVIRPRLSDAAFFFQTDKKSSLESRREKLKTIVFQAQLGSLYDKTERIRLLAAHICGQLEVDRILVDRAAQLCKSDLVSLMVYEFPDLQGIAGYHYALNDGETECVATAINEQYMPKFAGDKVPIGDAGAIIALADRIDTITGIFGIDQKPSGSKDPFALRRASLGVLRILVEKSYELDLHDLVKYAAKNFNDLPSQNTVVDDVLAYCLERFRAWYEEVGISAQIFQSVHAKKLTCPLDINRRVHAVAEFTKLPEAQSLAAANKRVSNILEKQTNDTGMKVDFALLKESSEKQLANALEKSITLTKPLVNASKYTDALSELAALKPPIDEFFDNVMVMTDNKTLRQNRLALLNQLRAAFLDIADISRLVVKA